MWRHVCTIMALVTLTGSKDGVLAAMLASSGSGMGSGGNGGGRVPCEEARLKCAYRTGCGRALQNYLMGCSSVLQGAPAPACPEGCQHALIALTSTDEGKDLMTCECSDDFCVESKQRVEVCRPQVVIANKNETVVSCRVAQWICAADALCSTALDYYNRYCRLMFHGKKCTHRCMNSISILRRQDKAAKLNTCTCDGNEDYDCPRIQHNMARLCFHVDATTVTTTVQLAPAGAGAGPAPSSPDGSVPRATVTSTSTLLVAALLLAAVT